MGRLVTASTAVLLVVGLADAGPPAGPTGLPGPEEVIAAKVDLWGEAALRQPGGPTYEFFAGLLPPLRYVDEIGRASCRERGEIPGVAEVLRKGKENEGADHS